MPAKAWESSFQLTKTAALASLERLSNETIEPNALMPHEPELDDYTRMRNTIAASAVAAWHLIQRRHGNEPQSLDKAMASFRPSRVADMLLWHCEAGEEMERLPGKPQSWRELAEAARTCNLATLPTVIRDDPDFALMFILAYPHRASIDLVKALDRWFG